MNKRLQDLLLMLALDLAMVNVAFALSYYVRYDLELVRPVLDANRAPYSAYLPMQAAYSILMLLFLAIDGAYRYRRGGSWLQDVYRIINASTTVGVIVIVIGTNCPRLNAKTSPFQLVVCGSYMMPRIISLLMSSLFSALTMPPRYWPFDAKMRTSTSMSAGRQSPRIASAALGMSNSGL